MEEIIDGSVGRREDIIAGSLKHVDLQIALHRPLPRDIGKIAVTVEIHVIAERRAHFVRSEHILAVAVINREKLGILRVQSHLIVKSVERLHHLVHIIEIAVVGHDGSTLDACVGDIEYAGSSRGAPLGVMEEIIVVVGCVDTTGLEESVGEHRDIKVVMIHLDINRVTAADYSHAVLYRVAGMGAVFVPITGKKT